MSAALAPDLVGQHALVLAPLGRDSSVAAGLLADVGIRAEICSDIDTLGNALDDRVTLAVITEEALRGADFRQIAGWVSAQPSWSDLPFIVLAHRGGPERNPLAAQLLRVFSNVVFLERPFHPTTFASVAANALKGRRRQFEARDRLEELRESGHRLRTAMLAARLGAWELDLSNSVMTCSESCHAVFGRLPGSVFGHVEFMGCIHPGDQVRVNEAMARSILERTDYVIEYRNLWPDGSTHWVDIRARFVPDGGSKGRLVGVLLDVTDRRDGEEQLRRLNETLEARVSERTAALEKANAEMAAQMRQRENAEEQLRQAQKMEAIGQLTGGVAHDFNNLLTAVVANLELLGKQVVGNPAARQMVDGAMQGARRGAALTQRLLAFARKQDLSVAPVDLGLLVTGMSGLIEKSVGPDIEISLDLPPNLPPALVDGNQVELALLNLVVNARDAMARGGLLAVELSVTDAPPPSILSRGRYLRLAVRDTGIGMDAETLRRATDPFFSTKEPGKGTGLGLSMIHGLAVQLDGGFLLSSKPGEGTVAELFFPAVEIVAEPVAPLPEPVVEKAAAIGSLAVLMVDDDFLIAMSTAMMIEDLGHKVTKVHSGPKALEVLRSGAAIDVMITDFAMPKMNGVELARAARELRPGLPILLATGYADPPGGDELALPRLGKPYSQGEIAQEIAKLHAG